MQFQEFPKNAKLYVSKNFGNDVNGNPRRWFEIYSDTFQLLGVVEDNYAGENFVSGRDIRRIGTSFGILSGVREYEKWAKAQPNFKNEAEKPQ